MIAISVGVLAIVIAVSAWRAINLGALALAATWVVGVLIGGESAADVLGSFPADLFVMIVGVTLLFGVARANGTVDRVVQGTFRLVRGRRTALPGVFFLFSALLCAVGAASGPVAVILIPVGMTVAAAHGVRSLVVALMVGMGATAGSFSPLGVFGIIVRRIQTDSGLPVDPLLLFLSTMVIGTAAAVLVGVLVRSTDDTSPTTVTGPAPTTPEATRPPRSAMVATLVGMAVLVVGAIGFGLDIGFLALTIAIALMLAHPDSAPGAVRDISWGIVLLLAGIVTYVGVLQRNGTIAWVADTVSTVQPALLAALLICVIGALVSAFASTAGILTAVVPLTVPLVATGDLSAVGLVAALAISSSLVDVSPFSTCGAIAMANAPEHERESIYRGLLVFAGAAAVAGPVVSWAVLVATGWF